MTLDENGLVMAQNFGALGLPTTYVKGTASPLGFSLLFNVDNIADYKESFIKDLIKKQAVYYHLDMSFFATKEAHFGVFVRAKDTPLVSLTKLLTESDLERMVLGIDSNGNKVAIDFNKTPHLLIGGSTGSGKTNLLKNLIVNIFSHYPKINRSILVEIIDTKYELKQFAQMKSVLHFGEGIKSTKKDSAYNCLKGACSIMDKRYKGIYKNDYELFVIIDELADLMLTTDMRSEVEDMLVRLASKGRACGIHLIIATQRPTVNVCSGLIKANMSDRIVLKTANKRDSVVILDHAGAESLAGNGDCIYKKGLDEIHLQIAYAEPQLLEALIKKYER